MYTILIDRQIKYLLLQLKGSDHISAIYLSTVFFTQKLIKYICHKMTRHCNAFVNCMKTDV